MKLRTFSPSTWGQFRECKLKVKYQKLDKLCVRCYKGTMSKALGGEPLCSACLLPAPEVPQLKRGSEIDGLITNYILGKADKPPLLANVDAQTAMEKMRALRIENRYMILPQEKFTFSRGMDHLPGFEFAVVTGILDVLVIHKEGHAQVIDWKTGSITPRGLLRFGAKDKYLDQLEIYAMMVLIAIPGVDDVDSSIYFVDATNGGREDMPSFSRADLDGLKRRWLTKIEILLNEEEFKKTPGKYCSWCDFNKSKGGPCDPKAP